MCSARIGKLYWISIILLMENTFALVRKAESSTKYFKQMPLQGMFAGTSGNSDYSPIYSNDMSNIFFARQETNGISIWSYNIANNFLSSYTKGMNPFPTKEANCILCTRTILQRRRLCYFS